MRTATPLFTWSKITEYGPSATSGLISTPRFIGPGCIISTSGFAYESFLRSLDLYNEIQENRPPNISLIIMQDYTPVQEEVESSSCTEKELDEDKWKETNNHFHNLHSDGSSQYNSSKRWFNQALMLYLLSKHNIIPNKDWLDYAEDARLVEKKVKRFNLEIGWDYLKFKIGFMGYWK